MKELMFCLLLEPLLSFLENNNFVIKFIAAQDDKRSSMNCNNVLTVENSLLYSAKPS